MEEKPIVSGAGGIVNNHNRNDKTSNNTHIIDLIQSSQDAPTKRRRGEQDDDPNYHYDWSQSQNSINENEGRVEPAVNLSQESIYSYIYSSQDSSQFLFLSLLSNSTSPEKPAPLGPSLLDMLKDEEDLRKEEEEFRKLQWQEYEQI